MKSIKNIFDFENNYALVIGGSGYIGKEIVKSLAELNCTIIVLDKVKPDILDSKIKFYYFNIDKSKNYIKKFKSILSNNKKINLFVNASYPKTKNWPNCSFKKGLLKSYDDNFNLHLVSFVLLTKIFLDHMIKNKIKGNIVNLSSMYGIVAQNKELYKNTNMQESLPYPIIKGGINMMTKQFASFYGSYGIRVNSVCPGGTIDKNLKKNLSKIFAKRYEKNVPLKRFAHPAEVAYGVIFLLSEASSYITGENLKIDGGWTII
jgi:NAD(P)-dependent dehydrogenase (short-subunit alcohol dehydrogenase family)